MRQSVERYPEADVAVRTWHVGDAPTRRLLCFPHSGATSTAFRPLARALGSDWSVRAVDPPGHGLGSSGPLLTSVPELAQRYVQTLPAAEFEDTWLLGFSLGGYVVHTLLGMGIRPNGVVFGAVPPYARRKALGYADMPGDELFERLSQLGGIPRGLGDVRAAFDAFAPVVRADFRAYATAPAETARFEGPALAIAGDADPLCAPDWLPEWQACFPALRTQVVEGPHVFVTTNPQALAAAIDAFAKPGAG